MTKMDEVRAEFEAGLDTLDTQAAEEFHSEFGYWPWEKLTQEQKANRYFGLPKDGLLVDENGKPLRNEAGQLVDENGTLIEW